MSLHASRTPRSLALSVVAAGVLLLTACRPVEGVDAGAPPPSPTATATTAAPTDPASPPDASPSPTAPGTDPTDAPTDEPTGSPTDGASETPTEEPTEAPTEEPAVGGPVTGPGDYAAQLDLLRSSPFRGTQADDWQYAGTPESDIPFEGYLGSREDYRRTNTTSDAAGPGMGQARIQCEYSHLSYDDMLVHPGKPRAAHLHQYFGNTDTNAFSTTDTLRSSGSSTCTGFTRSAYWVPAMLSGQGGDAEVVIPEGMNVYYKGTGLDDGVRYAPYSRDMAIVIDNAINVGMDGSEVSFRCLSSWWSEFSDEQETIPSCQGGPSGGGVRWLEMNVKFPNCWNGEDSLDPANLTVSNYNWFVGVCPESHPQALPILEYLIFFEIGEGNNTGDWYLSSDVDPQTYQVRADRGASLHADWKNAMDPRVNQAMLDGCTNVSGSECGFGFLTDKSDEDGPALKLKADYTGPERLRVLDVFADQCTRAGVERVATTGPEAAYCDPTGAAMPAGHQH